MLFFPAIDLMNGKCVRLLKGKKSNKFEYPNTPAEMASNFSKANADGIHVVDLDGAFNEKRKNMKALKDIIDNSSIPVEIGGGIRSLKDIESLFELGASRVILGTSAIKDPNLVSESIKKFGIEKIIVGIDAKNKNAAIKGWTETTNINSIDLANKMKDLGIKTIIYTDISKDGAMTGPNIKETENIAIKTGLDVIASGGVNSINNIKKLMEIEKSGVIGFICGKAIYDNKIDLKDVIDLIKGNTN